MKIKYDIVGSFLRPDRIKEARAAYKAGQIDLAALRLVEDEEISRLVKQQVDHGLTYVTDGEFRRRWWHLDWLKEFAGFTTKHLERERYGKIHQIELGYISGPISYNKNEDHPEIAAFDFLQKEAAKYPGVMAKKCISGPNMILVDNYLQLGIKEVPHYGSNIDRLISDIGQAYQAAIQDFYDHGCRYLQIDDTSWTYMIDDKFTQKVEGLGYSKNQVLAWFKEVSCQALAKKPKDMFIANHFCKGNFKGHPLFHGFYDSVAPVISQIPYDAFFVEYDDERSGSFAPWSVLKGKPAQFIAGLISTKNPQLEDLADIKQRLDQVRQIVGDNIGISPQCGFASVEEGNDIDEDHQWQKIDLLVEAGKFLT